jgi:hypothetical protein
MGAAVTSVDGNGSGVGGTAEPTTAEAVTVAQTFIEAIAWGEHRRVWELLAPEGRKVVLRVAVKNGMDEALAARLRDGTAGPGETEEFLAELLTGLRADLAGNDLDSLEYSADQDASPERVRIMLSAPVPPLLGPVGLPVGSVEVARHDGQWLVERLTPRPDVIA